MYCVSQIQDLYILILAIVYFYLLFGTFVANTMALSKNRLMNVFSFVGVISA